VSAGAGAIGSRRAGRRAAWVARVTTTSRLVSGYREPSFQAAAAGQEPGRLAVWKRQIRVTSWSPLVRRRLTVMQRTIFTYRRSDDVEPSRRAAEDLILRQRQARRESSHLPHARSSRMILPVTSLTKRQHGSSTSGSSRHRRRARRALRRAQRQDRRHRRFIAGRTRCALQRARCRACGSQPLRKPGGGGVGGVPLAR
jgi:hypothetical protein